MASGPWRESDPCFAMVLDEVGKALRGENRPLPEPHADQLRIRVTACAVCRTDLHIVDGELPPIALPIIPGHEIVGQVDAVGPDVFRMAGGATSGGSLAWRHVWPMSLLPRTP